MSQHPTTERGQEVRRRLLSAAAELVPVVGWSAVSTRMLAERAGVAPGLVHYHFASLPALLREAALELMGEVMAATVPALEGVDDLDEWLTALLGSLEEYSGTDPTSLLFTETYLAATRDEELRQELAALVARFTDALARWLEGHGQVEPRGTALVLAAAVDGLMLHRALNPELTAAAVAPVLRRLLTDER